MNTNLSNKSLTLALIFAILLAIIIYYIIILPAEFNKDPTGIGQKLGLMVLLENSETTIPTKPTIITNKQSDLSLRNDEAFIIVPAHKGIEYKFNLQKYGRLVYEWQTLDESSIYFDFHGEPKGDTTGFFESYCISTAIKSNGTATVPFEGSHGWYWKNTSDNDVNIKLTTSGNYTIIGLK